MTNAAMISIGEALGRVLAAIRPLPAEQVPLEEAVGRSLAADVHAPFDVPSFENSQMDGFALRAGDLAGASEERPARLRITGTAAAGHPFGGRVGPGEAVRIMTGAPVPDGADAVVPIEDAVAEGDLVRIPQAVPARRFVRPAGEDLRSGELVLEKGRLLRAADVGLLASLGQPTVPVIARPRVAILGTGDELVPLGRPLGPGQIHDSNAYALAAAVREVGGIATLRGIVADDRDSLRAAMSAVDDFDVVLSTGGVSVGDFDYVKEIMDEIGLERHFWRVAQKPGKPIVFASRAGSSYFGLPGNPVSALVCFWLYVAPALRRAMGLHGLFPPAADVRLEAPVRTALNLTELVRCTLRWQDGRYLARATGTQSSGALRSLSLADALVISPPGVAELVPGEEARALLLRSPHPLAATHPFD